MKNLIFVLLLCPILLCGCKDEYDPNNPLKNTSWKCVLEGDVTLLLNFHEDNECYLNVKDGDHRPSYVCSYTCYPNQKPFVIFQFPTISTDYIIHDGCLSHRIRIQEGYSISNNEMSVSVFNDHIPHASSPYGHVVTASGYWWFEKVD